MCHFDLLMQIRCELFDWQQISKARLILSKHSCNASVLFSLTVLTTAVFLIAVFYTIHGSISVCFSEQETHTLYLSYFLRLDMQCTE